MLCSVSPTISIRLGTDDCNASLRNGQLLDIVTNASCQSPQPIKAVASLLRYQVSKWLAFASRTACRYVFSKYRVLDCREPRFFDICLRCKNIECSPYSISRKDSTIIDDQRRKGQLPTKTSIVMIIVRRIIVQRLQSSISDQPKSCNCRCVRIATWMTGYCRSESPESGCPPTTSLPI